MSLLTIQNLKLAIAGQLVLQGVDMVVNSGETVALLGESGSGKSMTAASIIRLLPLGAEISIDSHIEFAGEDLLSLSELMIRKIRGRRIGMVFQEPMTALNPVLTVGDQISEVLELHLTMRSKAAYQRTLELLHDVELAEPERIYRQYPHQLSGGMRQRVVIAMAIAANPALLIADEATSALDIFTQTQILQLLKNLQQKINMAILFITHDIKVAKRIANKIIVLKAGKITEHINSELIRRQA